MKRITKSKIIFTNIFIFLFLVLWLFIYFYIQKNENETKWTLILYSKENSGLSNLNIDTKFTTLNECKTHANYYLKNKYLIPHAEKPEMIVADGYLCGVNCSVDALMGSVFISEYNCTEKFIE